MIDYFLIRSDLFFRPRRTIIGVGQGAGISRNLALPLRSSRFIGISAPGLSPFFFGIQSRDLESIFYANIRRNRVSFVDIRQNYSISGISYHIFLAQEYNF
jgi:hypothetical protein